MKQTLTEILNDSRPSSFEALKECCFKQNVNPSLKEFYRRSWATHYPIYVTHKISIRLVWLLLKSRITPNQITVVSYIVGLMSGLFFWKANSHFTLFLAALLFEIFYILDAVDGQLARARNEGSSGGKFLDEWGNFLIAPFIIFCVGLHFAGHFYPWPASLAAFALLSIPIIEILTDRAFPKKRGIDTMIAQPTDQNKKRDWIRLLYSLLYRSCTMPVAMNLVTLSTLLTLFKFRPPINYDISFLGLLIYYYSIIGTFIWTSKGIKIAFSES